MILYKQIERNKRNTVFIVGGFILFFLIVGGSFTYVTSGDVVMKMNHAKEVPAILIIALALLVLSPFIATLISRIL